MCRESTDSEEGARRHAKEEPTPDVDFTLRRLLSGEQKFKLSHPLSWMRILSEIEQSILLVRNQRENFSRHANISSDGAAEAMALDISTMFLNLWVKRDKIFHNGPPSGMITLDNNLDDDLCKG